MLSKTLLIPGLLATLPVSQAADILLVTNSNSDTQSLRDFLAGEGHSVTVDHQFLRIRTTAR